MESLRADETNPKRRETNIRAGRAGSIVSVTPGPARPTAVARSAAGDESRPRPRLVGFSPLVAITTSDERRSRSDLEFEHDLQTSYVGSPLINSATPDFVIGFLDSGATVELAAGGFAETLGLTGDVLTVNTIGIGGVGETVEGIVTQPVGFFTAGLSAISADGELDLSALVGHTNVSGVVSPPLDCSNGEVLSAVIGTPLMAFFTSIIRVDTPISVTVDGQTFKAPDVQLQDPFDDTPLFSHFITMNFGGLAPATTANFFPDFLDLETPFFPTLLSTVPGSIPTGGAFFVDILVLEGIPDPLNPALLVHMILDTGAQSSIISPGVAANLSLPITPDFTVDVCGVGGLVQDVPGYYIDIVKMNALGGALEFSQAPFIVLDLPSPEGGSLDGIVGMNFFWNRNVIFDPFLTGTGFFHVSDPVPFAYADFDLDFDVDGSDNVTLTSCLTGPLPGTINPECTHLDNNQDGTVDLREVATFQACYSGLDQPADLACGGK